MNDYIETPEGTRVRFVRPPTLDRGAPQLEGSLIRPLENRHIDANVPSEPPPAV